MHDVFIGIGSNIGDRELNCSEAIRYMSQKDIIIRSCSSMIETKPWGKKDQPDFINMVVRISTDKGPRELLGALRSIEAELGRTRKEKWGPREIDLDILLFDDLSINDPDLKIPHPHMLERDFVMGPLSEIAPDVAERLRSR
ncbi:MAG: 2-amino-4-hydroxy-6-hydroxymethyldihydropteridine diphosphokinase [Nitrospirota bacterium]|nr:MAG: 2-amino-4-hydroxy-6-hydroxymethyldihydropteridine diphosphokinase [Nitrospirota bacterium]